MLLVITPLGLFPNLIHLIMGHTFGRPPLLYCFLLEVAKPFDELLVGTLQSLFRSIL